MPLYIPIRAALLLVFVAPAAPADMISPEGLQPYEVCGLCHGLDGVSPMAKFPKLAGQPAGYLEKQLRDIRAGARTNDGGQMAAIVGEDGELAEADIPVVAAWFANQPDPPPDAGDPPGAGAEVYAAAGCGGCHDTASPLVPLLTAQHEGYLAKQMRDFRDGLRNNAGDAAKTVVMSDLSEDDIAVLSSYLARIPRSR